MDHKWSRDGETCLRCGDKDWRAGADCDDLCEHLPSADCWCKPTQDEDEPSVWIHHSMDRREEYEQGRKPS